MRIFVLLVLFLGLMKPDTGYALFGSGCNKAIKADDAAAALKECADSGDKEALFYLSKVIFKEKAGYYDNLGTGLALLVKAADQGYEPAGEYLHKEFMELADNALYSTEMFTLPTSVTAEECQKKFEDKQLIRLNEDGEPYHIPYADLCVKALKGEASAQYAMANFLAQRSQDSQAYPWFELAAKNGDEKSIFLKGLFSCYGTTGKKKDTDAAKAWFEKASGETYGKMAQRQLDFQKEHKSLLCEAFPSNSAMREHINQMAMLTVYFRPARDLSEIMEFMKVLKVKNLDESSTQTLNKYIARILQNGTFRSLVTVASKLFELEAYDAARKLVTPVKRANPSLIDPKHIMFPQLAFRISGSSMAKQAIASKDEALLKKALEDIATAALLGDDKSKEILQSLKTP